MKTKDIKTISNLNWYYGGTLNKPKFVHGGGVYLLVYGGVKNRIVYVGTTVNFENRWFEHIEGMKRGNRAIWKVSPNQDIYELMSAKGYKDYFRYYKRLADDKLLWASTNVLKIKPTNDLNQEDHFLQNWFYYVCNEYMPNIHLWGCRMSERYDFSTLLESQIQRAFYKNYSIKTHINKSDMCWLGKIENTHQDLFNLRFEFNTYPDIDEKSLLLLKNLTEKNIIKFKKENISTVSKQSISSIRRSRIRKLRKTYSQAYYPWDRDEDRIILFLLERQMSVDEMVKYLNRTPAEITRRIEKLKVLASRKK